jgi:Ni2+-binding GTPase involved in maturation of urease and hydrogenase
MKVHLVSGFLGSGKTTAIASAIRGRLDAGTAVAAITNDQGSSLVDTEFLKSFGVTTGEVTGGCFCCSFADFASELERIRREARAEVVFAEAVGSCTDLVATVARPLASGYAGDVELGSYSVFVDIRLLGMWLSGMGLPFTADVSYVFECQLREADVLVVNKADLMTPVSAKEILRRAQAAFPKKTIILQCSLDPRQVEQWYQRIDGLQAPPLEAIDVDYDRYGAGEARLAWYDATIDLRETRPSLGAAVTSFAGLLGKRLSEENVTVGHAKLFVHGAGSSRKLSMSFDATWDDTSLLDMEGTSGAVIVNLRAEAPADLVKRIVEDCLETLVGSGSVGSFVLGSERAFHPGFPVPTHRIP